jgi:MtrB/PioB family decaheme-associated outer membrane protein
MKVRTKIAKTCLLGALLSTTAMVSTGALAQMATKAPPAVDDQYAPWWFHGTVEAGGRGFTNDPQDHGLAAYPQTAPAGQTLPTNYNVNHGKSLAGYYEYSDIAPGAFGNFDLSTGSKDGLYRIDAGGKNVGYKDQSYYFDASKAGEHYFNFYWDQSPHVYSRSALTPYTVGGNMVNLVPGAAAIVVANGGGGTFPGNTAAFQYSPYAAYMELGIQRDTAAASYRWTPTEAWDFNADYAHMKRTGTQVQGGYEAPIINNQLFPKPVDDSTQNYDAKGQYVGTSPWGQRLVVQAGYEGSDYQDKFTDILVEGGATKTVAGPSPQYAAFSAWPSNRADAFTSTVSADLPWNSRYIGTFNYGEMRQTDGFAPAGDINIATGAFTNTAAAITGNPANLGGRIDTLLSNNIINTKISDTVTAKTSFRYYDQDNRTPEYLVTAGSNSGATGYALSMSYIKMNAGEELNWRPNKYWNLGVAYDYERYDWTRADAGATDQSDAKVFADYKPFTWLTSRASGEFSSRRAENYDYLGLVGGHQWLTPAGTSGEQYLESYRQFMFDNRQVWTGKYQLDVVVAPGVTVTPWTKYTDASYSVDPNTQQGLEDSRRWDSGVDATWVARPDLSFTVGYSWDYQNALAITNCFTGGTTITPGAVCTISARGAVPATTIPAQQFDTSDKQTQNFITAAIKYTPTEQLDLSLRYTGSAAVDNMQLNPPIPPSLAAGGVVSNTNGQFIPNKVWYERLDATAVYKLSPEQVAALGWKGTIKAKLNWAWERNSESNYANDPLSPYTIGLGTSTQADLWMGQYNPNYNVQMITGSLIASW